MRDSINLPRRSTLRLILSIPFFALSALAKDQGVELKEIRQRVRAFLDVWLSKRDAGAAIRFFHPKAFDSPAMYRGNCGAFGAQDFFTASGTRKGAVLRALEWYIDQIGHRSEIFRPDGLVLDPSVRPLNDMERDHFAVFSSSQLENMKASWVNEVPDTLKKVLAKKSTYLVVLPLIVAPCFLVWSREHEDWRIVHAETVCE